MLFLPVAEVALVVHVLGLARGALDGAGRLDVDVGFDARERHEAVVQRLDEGHLLAGVRREELFAQLHVQIEGVFVALAVAGCFNAVLMNVYLWSMPAIALALFVAERPWRVWRVRTVSLIVGGAIVLAGGTLAGIEAYGRAKLKRLHPIFVEDGRVCVKDDSPNIWIVDDSKALGGVLSPCRDIRRYFLRHPSAPSVGYVRNVEKLPRKRVDRLVLAGKAGQDWLDWIYKCAEKGEEVSQFFPKELVFISPIFLPSALPEGIEEACKVKYVIGEFVARYHPDEFERPPEWVKVVPGMELYIQNWMRFAVE